MRLDEYAVDKILSLEEKVGFLNRKYNRLLEFLTGADPLTVETDLDGNIMSMKLTLDINGSKVESRFEQSFVSRLATQNYHDLRNGRIG